MDSIGKALVVFGLGLAAIGAILWWSPPGFRLFRLPGDIVIERDNFTFAFPITSMALISLALMALGWIVSALRK